MPASVSDIARLTRESVTVSATASQVQTNHGTAARDNSDAPIATFYDAQASATTLLTTRLSLLSNPGSNERRLVEIDVSGILLPTGSLACNSVTPTVYLEDGPSRLAGYFAVVEFSYDFANERTTLTLFG